ncbi:hypothetical protein [Hydrogenophaga sp.]|uniref:hypothetical protein n=1 Tax=Hydrogenophaga sp. TaxID=1904254 RepID=UPI002731BCA7|nr:hypothetical protein [Hydrogenophaga sp.]MDP2017325.1 hypothetical protein [Hydrogenophaga sp.]MDP3164879.1 hypothetical protein [Hydrogenophaga sp.]MDP3812552.1 hypothetical protein [Hydrogenophaga sp.]
MRRLLVLILCLLMPLQGFAALQVAAAPCPMQGMMTMDMGATNMADAMEDCCNDLATFERTGQACKTGQECTAPAVWMPPFQPVEFKALAAQDLTAPVWRSPPPGATSRLWRPPTSV